MDQTSTREFLKSALLYEPEYDADVYVVYIIYSLKHFIDTIVIAQLLSVYIYTTKNIFQSDNFLIIIIVRVIT